MTPLDLDYAARQVIMASMAYYGLDEAILDDGLFDKLCVQCADHWQALTPQRKFALGSAEKIRTTGYHVRVSSLAESATASRLVSMGLYDLTGPRKIFRSEAPKFSKTIGHWLPCTSYAWGERDDYPPSGRAS